MCETPILWEAVFALASLAGVFIGMLWAYVVILKWGDGF